MTEGDLDPRLKANFPRRLVHAPLQLAASAIHARPGTLAYKLCLVPEMICKSKKTISPQAP
jgi:hypothetical protein